MNGAGRAMAWVLDRVFAIRPLLWIPAVAVYAAGRAWGSRELGRDDFAAPPIAAGPIASLLLILAAVHAANAWRDREGDRFNRKGFPVASGLVGGRAVLTLALGSLLAAAALAVGASILEQRLLIAALFLGAAYVLPPLELKRRPIADLLAHGTGYGIVAFLLGAAGGGGPERAGVLGRALVAAVPYALGIMTVSLLTMLADLGGDERAGQRTTAVALGSARAEAASRALAWGTMGAGLWAGELTPTLWGALAVALLSLGARPESRDPAFWSSRSIQLQLLFLAILAAQAPVPLLVAVLLGGASQAYNRWRWGIGYPLRGVSGGGA